jgi:hypothetical protein
MKQANITCLLYQQESETLDFKRDQYPLEQATNETKSEFIKDVLAFANAWRNTDAFILLGVVENPGGKALVMGVTCHLADADLQQLVNGKTNKPVRFGYQAVTLEGEQVGLLHIDRNQDRPIYLRKDFGKLRKNVVYVRRGSSTAEASPEEIAAMGAERAGLVRELPVIEFGFGDRRSRQQLGREVTVTSTVLVDPAPPAVEIPDIGGFLQRQFSYIPVVFRRPTPEEVKAYSKKVCLLGRIGFWARNRGTVLATGVRAEILVPKQEGLVACDDYSYPQVPGEFPGFRASGAASDVNVDEHTDAWTVHVDFGRLQSQAEAWTGESLYVGSTIPQTLCLEAKLFADELDGPVSMPLTLEVKPEQRTYRAKDFEGREEQDEVS